MADADAEKKRRKQLQWTRDYERLGREMLGETRVASAPGDTEGRNHPHAGSDFSRPFISNQSVNGLPVRAPAAGTVVRTGKLGDFGNAVVLERDHHGRKVTEIFGHLQDESIPSDLKRGTQISYGDVIGRVGNTGRSTGPHLHYETRATPYSFWEEDPRRPAADGELLWPDGRPPYVDPREVQDFSDLSRYTFGIRDPRVLREVEAHIRRKFGQRRTGEVSGTGPNFDQAVREEVLRKAASMLSIDQLAKLGEEDFAWATHGDYWRQIMDPSFKP